jgi:hypothetical protein
MAYFYIASPYTHINPEIMRERFLLVEHYTAQMLKSGTAAYSPIVHCHEMVQRHKLPTDHKFWADYNFAMIAPSIGVQVLHLPGWQESKGVAEERRFADARSIPVIEIDPHHPWLLSYIPEET